MLNIRHSLIIRIVVSVAVTVLVLGVFLYFLVLATISGFVQDEIQKDLQFLSHRIFNICNISFDTILQSGFADDQDRIIVKQALTLGEIEDFFQQHNLEGLVYQTSDNELLLETNLPMNSKKIITEAKSQEKAISLGSEAEGYFAYHFDFSPWLWHIIIMKSEKEYAGLIAKVKRVHGYTLGLFILATFLSAFFLYQSINRPINAIIEPIRKGRRPQYKGIDVFEFLSGTITAMMDSLHQSEEKYRSLVETTSDFVWEVDRDGVYTYASPKIKDILGYEPAEVIGKQPFDLMPPGEAERVREIFRTVLQSGRPFERLERVNLHKNGCNVVLETSGIPVPGPGGNILGYRGIDRDITERLRADRMGMLFSLELRVPFFDVSMVDLGMKIAPELKIREHNGEQVEKWILRKAFEGTGYLPEEILWRYKLQYTQGAGGEDLGEKLAECEMTDGEYERIVAENPDAVINSKEAAYYFKISREYHPQESVLNSIGIWNGFDFAEEREKVRGTVDAGLAQPGPADYP